MDIMITEGQDLFEKAIVNAIKKETKK